MATSIIMRSRAVEETYNETIKLTRCKDCRHEVMYRHPQCVAFQQTGRCVAQVPPDITNVPHRNMCPDCARTMMLRLEEENRVIERWEAKVAREARGRRR